MELVHSGKVRDVYADGDDLILVASDRVSVFDVVLPTPIPDKGKVLTQLSLWWFDQLADIVAHHVISATDVPQEWAGRALRCRRLDMVKVECVARGYLTGTGLRDYQRDGAVSGVALPAGLVEASRLPEPIFTPTTKAQLGEHDEPITFAEVVDQEGQPTAEELRRITLGVYRRGSEIAAPRGIIIADTKVEIGRSPEGTLVLADEVLTPDSSRFWPADEYEPGRVQHSYDKQMVRDWAAATGWDKTPPGPELPPDLVEAVLALSPIVEFVDPDNAGWDKGFPAFVVHAWRSPAPGPTWFLGVLLVFSAVYAGFWSLASGRWSGSAPVRPWHLITAGIVIALGSYAARLVIPLGEERWHLALGQAPAWVVGFSLGALGGERGWLRPLDPVLARRVRRLAWASLAAIAFIFFVVSAVGMDLDAFGGGGNWQSLLLAALEGAIVVTVAPWLLDAFRRRFNHQGRLAREMSRAAFAAFVVHQVILVGLVLASRHVSWPPEVNYVMVSTLAVGGSFALGAVLVRVPGISRVV